MFFQSLAFDSLRICPLLTSTSLCLNNFSYAKYFQLSFPDVTSFFYADYYIFRKTTRVSISH